MQAGKNQIVYQPTDLQSGKNVTARVYTPDATVFDTPMEDQGNGLYFAYIGMYSLGPYIIHILVDGELDGKQIFRIDSLQQVIPYPDS